MSPQEPSHWIYQMKHGDILIARLEDPKEAPLPMTNNIIASRKTLSTLTQSHQAAPVDPWLTADPWQSGGVSKKPPSGVVNPSVTPGQLTALGQRLEQKINAAASEPKPDQMQVDHTDRIEALERQVTSLTQNFSQFQQQQSKINNQISCQLQGFEGRIDSKLEDQMQRIEAPLSKKMRREWLSACLIARVCMLPVHRCLLKQSHLSLLLVNSGVQSNRGGQIRVMIRHRDQDCFKVQVRLRIRRQTIRSRGKNSLRCFVVFVHSWPH